MFQDQFIHSVQDVSLLDTLREIVVPTTEFDISHSSILFNHAFFVHESLAKVGRSSVAGGHSSKTIGTFPQVVKSGSSVSVAAPTSEQASIPITVPTTVSITAAISSHATNTPVIIVGVPVVELHAVVESLSFPIHAPVHGTFAVAVNVVNFVILLKVLLGCATRSPIVMRIRVGGKVGAHLQSTAAPGGSGYPFSVAAQGHSFERRRSRVSRGQSGK